jgi:APA family basic amino acid/polyamine antiporter
MSFDSKHRLVRSIEWPTAAAVVAGNMIGAGIFTTSGFIARDTGSARAMLALWIAGGIVALIGALAYAELGAAMPEAGGEYVYLREAYGPVAGYLSGWTSFFAGFSGAIAAALLAFAGYLVQVLPALALFDQQLVAIATLWILAGIHLAGARRSGRLQNLLTGATVIAIAGLVCAGFAVGHGSFLHFSSAAPAHGSAAVALIFVLYAYSGWNGAAYLAGEIIDPARGLPRALIAGTGGVIALYVALNALYVWALPISAMSGVLAVGGKAAATLFGPRATTMVAALIALAILSSASAMMMAGPRVYFAMARDGVFPEIFASARDRSGPAASIVLQATWTTALILVFGVFERVVLYAGFAITLFSTATVAAVVVLRLRKGAAQHRPFLMPGYPWLAIGYVAVSAWVAVYVAISSPVEAAWGVVTAVGGLPVYWLMRRGRVTRSPARLRASCRSPEVPSG